MKTFTKVSLITSLVCIGLGIPMIAVGACASKDERIMITFDHGFHVIDDDDIVTREKSSIDDFKNVNIDISEANIEFLENDADEYAVEYCLYQIEDEIQCEVKDDELIICNEHDNHFHFEFNFYAWGSESDNRYVKIYYPKGAELGDIKLETSAGKINMRDDLTCNSLDIDSSAGACKLANLKSNAVTTDMSAGSMTIENCDLGVCDFDMSAGSCTIINSTLDGGSIDMSAGSFEATGFTLTASLDMDMSAGSVDIEFVDGQEIGYKFDLSAGSAKINGEKRGDDYEEVKGYDIILTVDASAGSVDITNN